MKPAVRFLTLLLALVAWGPPGAWAQTCASPGKDGPGSINANPNTYYPGVTANAAATSITVGTARGVTATAPAIAANDLLLVIQMQGAEISTSNTNAYGDGATGDPANGYLTTGLTAGQYEYVVASGAVGAVTPNVVNITTPLQNTYTTSAVGAAATRRTFQVVRVPQYTTLTLTGNVSPLFWNGATGGITAVDVQGLMAFGNFKFDASSLGFRGGAGIKQLNNATATNRVDYLSTAASALNAQKGEGIAGSPRFVNYSNGVAGGAYTFQDMGTANDNYPGGSSGRGAPGNAGGGGNDNGNNSGGGGGANGGPGGHGGYSSVTATPANTTNATTSFIGGEPGAAFTASSSSRLIMGGGGGAGSTNDGSGNAPTNNGFTSSGTPGGGIVIVRAGAVSGTVGGTGGISANGGNVPAGVLNDGGGGAGSGGTILLTVAGSQTGLADLTMSAIGGTGGNVNPGGGPAGSTAHGPGGGGGGGIVFTSGTTRTGLVTSTAGGNNGTTTPAGLGTGYDTSAFGATDGTAGSGQSSVSTSNAIANSASGAACSTINGTIFDDSNYGGGTGRPYSTANTSAVASGLANNAIGSVGTTVELYDNNGAFVATTTTTAGGAYSFTGLTSGINYTVRVVNSTVKSARTPGATGLSPVQTFRTTAYTGTGLGPAAADGNRVGGEAPERQDANARTGTQTLAQLTAGTATPQSITVVRPGTSGVDFGYNFDTVVNTNDAGQGSLRQFITNANALGSENLLAQSGLRTDIAGAPVALAAGTESSIFMIPNGATANAPAGLRNGLTSGLNANGVAALAPATALPAVTGANTSIDGTTQTFNIGNTNNVALGAGGTVGTGSTSLSQVNGPEVQLKGITSINGIAIATNTNNTTVRGLSIYGFSTGIFGGINDTGTRIEQNVIGASATSFADPGAGNRNLNEGINLNDSDNGFVTNNLIGFNGGMGIWAQTTATSGSVGSNGNTITGNEVRGNAITTNAGRGERLVFDGIELQNNSTGNTVSGNLITANYGHGIDSFGNTVGGNTITGNTISNNGVGVATGAGEEGSGLRIFGATNPTIVSNNVLTGNNGSGVLVLGSANQVTISQNSTSGNTRLGIDLLTTGETNTNNTGAGTIFWNGQVGANSNVTVNDNGDTATGGNGLLNFPVLTTATLNGTALVINGYARPGSLVELFLATPLTTDPTAATASPNRGFGQGSTFLVGRTEGLAADDSNTGTGTYSGLINGLAQGTDNTNLFTFTVPLSSLTAAQQAALLGGSAVLTSTATINRNTSEFSGNLALPVADVTVALTGPTTLAGGQPTGNFTATFTNQGPQAASNVAQTVTLPTGAIVTQAQRDVITAAYLGTTFSTTGTGANAVTTINFGTAATLALGSANAFTFAFTAPAAAGASTIAASTSTTTSEGTNAAPNTTSLSLTTGGADVTAAIVAGAATVAPGQAATFTASFANNGPQNAAGVVRTVQLPAGLGNNVTASNGGTYNNATGLVTYTATTLTSGAAASTSTISFTMPATGPVVATASVSTTTSENGQTANNVASASSAVGAQFDLTTTLYGPTSATAVAGSPVTLNVTTTNNGPQAVAGALQTVQLVAGLTNVYVSGNGVYNASASASTVTYNGTSYSVPAGGVIFPPNGNLPSGQTVTNSITFNAPTPTTSTPDVSFAPSAQVTPNTTGAGETNTANNSAFLNGNATSTNLVVSPASATRANVYAVISTASKIVSAGTQVTFTAGVGNSGPAAATGVAAQLQLIPGLSTATIQVANQTGALNAANNTITFSNTGTVYSIATGLLTYTSLPSLASGSSFTSTVAVTMPTTVGNNGQLLATVSVSSTSTDFVPSDNVQAATVTVIPTTDLATTVTGPTSPSAGQQVSYTATFTNNGPDIAANTTETVQLPTGLGSVTVLDNQGNAVTGASYSAITGVVTLPTIASNAVGASQAFTIAFAAPAQGYTVSSAVGSSTLETITANNSARVTATVAAAADVAVAIAGPATAVAGNAVTYAVTTRNNGFSPATGVAATLQLPIGLAGVTAGPGGASYDGTTGVVTFATGPLPAGGSAVNYVTFTMPTSPTNGQVSGVASVTTTSTDNVASNNTAGITTDVAPATTTTTNLVAGIVAPGTPVTAGSALSYTFNFRNTGPAGAAATNVAPVAYLPTGLSGVVVSDGGTYNPATGLVTWPLIATQASGNLAAYKVDFAAPGSSPLVVASFVSSSTSETDATDNRATSSVNVTAVYDPITSLSGPATALPGSVGVYAVTTTNNGPSTAPSVTQTVTLPAGVTATNLPAGASQSGTTLTFATITNQAAGANGAVTNTFTVAMPATGSLALSATVASSGESNTGNDGATLTTAPANQPPVAQNIVNSLQSARGNTASAQLAITPLNAADPDGTVSSYALATLPSTSQGLLYYNGALATTSTVITDGSKLSFVPAAGFVGNAFFTYTAIDNNGTPLTSIPALYTLPVAQDQSTIYTAATAKGGSANKYVTNDVLAFTIDPNTAVYNNAGVIYNAAGAIQPTTGNLAPTNGLGGAVLAATGPTQNPANTLPPGVSVNPTTGQVFVSNASLLLNNSTAMTYYLNVVTTDLNGGTNTALATFTIGAYPLPVELTAFTAAAVGNRDAALAWRTASEKHNDRFEVERSLDGTSFAKIGQVKGQGSTSAASAYAFTDAGIGAKATGAVYYRLAQVDADGTVTHSPVRSVAFAKAAGPLAIGLYPNPAVASTQLDLNQLPAGTYQVRVIDMAGRAVLSATLAGAQRHALDLTALASGSYAVQVRGTAADGTAVSLTKRLVKE